MGGLYFWILQKSDYSTKKRFNLIKSSNCPICQSILISNKFIVSDMMHNEYIHTYQYNECKVCNCLYINNYERKENLYDNSRYYSFVTSPKKNNIKYWLTKKRVNAAIFEKNNIYSFLNRFNKINSYNLHWLKQLKITDVNVKILDVGCGSGSLLIELQNYGLLNLTGIDPYLLKDFFSKHITILKKDIFEIDSEFDIIMFHHVLEHIDNQQETLTKSKKLLSNNGKIIIRTPYKYSYAWSEYKENWVQIDAPRHQIIHSQKSLNYLFDNVGLKVQNVIFDSTSFQFIGSEQYKRGICLNAECSYYRNKKKSIFGSKIINKWEDDAKLLNYRKSGDQISIVLSK